MTQSAAIRAAQPADAAAIADIWNAAIRDTTATFTTREKSPDQIARQLAEAPLLVAALGDTIIGFATYGPFRGGPGYADAAEHSVYVAPGRAGRGTGRALLQALEAQARAAGLRHLVAGIGGENHAAQRFHAAMGYAEVGRMPGIGTKFGRRHDLVLMQKALD